MRFGHIARRAQSRAPYFGVSDRSAQAYVGKTRLFATLDLSTSFCLGVSLADGIRNSPDQCYVVNPVMWRGLRFSRHFGLQRLVDATEVRLAPFLAVII